MTDLDLPLHSPALYNPHLLSKEELLGLFSARQALLEQLLDDLRATPRGESAQHHLILGQRGMGKTMLLRRIQFAVEDDLELAQTWLALSFPEEQYNVAGLSDFWLNCIDALSDTLERLSALRSPEKIEKVVEGLDEAVKALRKEPEDERANRALDVLVSAASALNRRLLLLVDNADLVLDRIGEQDWSLREVLSSHATVTFLGASAAAIESTYEYGKAFYDFFRIHHLSGLTIEETQSLLLQYAEAQGNDDVKTIVDEEPGRLRTLHTLTGGNPRTLVLLFNIFVKGPGGDVRSDIEQLLDQCTPLYKARFEALPAQAQQVVDALALHWDPTSAGELAEALRMPVNNVSAQLNRLVGQGVVEKVAYEPESKTGFQIAERFFNIWYLMRASRRVRRRLLWLVEFLRMFYSQDELRRRVEHHLRLAAKLDPRDRLRHAEYSFALASAFEEGPLRGALERSALQMLVRHDDLRTEIRELMDFEGTDAGLKSRAESLQRFEALRRQLIEMTDDGVLPRHLQLPEMVLRAPLSLGEKERIVMEVKNAGPEKIVEIAKAHARSEQRFLDSLASADTAEILLCALEEGYMETFDDVEGARLVQTSSGARGLVAVAAAARVEREETTEALTTLEASLDHARSPYPWLVWLRERGQSMSEPEIQLAFGKICELSAHDSDSLSGLGFILHVSLDRHELAEKALRLALGLAPEDPRTWSNLGTVLMSLGRLEEAEDAIRKAIDEDPGPAPVWANLGGILNLLGRWDEAQVALRKAIDIDPEDWAAWSNLGNVLRRVKRTGEAEAALRKAVEIRADLWPAWLDLGRVLEERGKWTEAEEAIQRAIQIDKGSLLAWQNLASVLVKLGRIAEAEGAIREALELEAGSAEDWYKLGVLLARQDRLDEAEDAFRKAINLNPLLPEAWWRLALLLKEQGRLGESEHTLRLAVERNPSAALLWCQLAVILEEQDRWSAAEEILRDGMEVASSQGELQNTLAWLLFETERDLTEAEQLAQQAAKSESAGPEENHTWACILVRNKKWNEAIEPARNFLEAWVAEFPEGIWPDIVAFFREAVRAGRAREATDLLDELELGERWRPLREALEAVALDNARYLRRVAPEVRGPAEAILKELSEAPEGQT